MAIIYSFPLNDDIKLSDELVGTTKKVSNGRLKTVTRNFSISDLAVLFSNSAGIEVTAGNGMNFSPILSNGTVTLGTPSSITLSSTNGLTATSHTHAFAPGGLVSQYITGAGTLVTFPLTPNLQQVTDSGANTTNPITITIPEPTAVPFYTNNFSSGFGDFVPSPNNDADWTIVSNEAKSGVIPNNGKSGISLTKFCPTDVTILQYTYRTSTEQDYDYLFVILDGVVIKSYSGNISTTTDSIAIQKSGNHTIQFVYAKDNGDVFGDDTVWLDNVSLTSGENALTVNKSVYFKDSLYLNNLNAIGSVSAKTIYANNLDIRNVNGDRQVIYGPNGIGFYEPTQNALGNYFVGGSTSASLQVKVANGIEIFKALGTATTAAIQIPNPNASVHIGQYSDALPTGYMFNVVGTSLFKNTVTATSFIKSGAGPNQILAADGQIITAGTNITISGGTISSSGGGGGGDMLKSVYDIDNNGVVDKAQSMITRGRNSTGATLVKGTIVYILGATGQLPNFVKSIASGEGTSAGTFGVINADILNNANGEATTIGLLEGLDTRTNATNPFTDAVLNIGDTLYLHPTIAGYVTNIKPVAPNHLVYVGKVINVGPSTQGAIVYRIQNGYELDELHDVLITSKTNGDVLQYESSTSLWKNKQPTTTGYAPYGQVPVWTSIAGGSAPSGATTNYYRWTKIGNLVTLTLWLVYDINGVNTISVTAPFPSGAPTPWIPPVTINASHVINYGVGTIVPGRSSYSPAPGVCALILATESPITFSLVAEREAGVNGQAVYMTISYFAT